MAQRRKGTKRINALILSQLEILNQKLEIPAEFLSILTHAAVKPSRGQLRRESLSIIRCKVDVKSGISYGYSRVHPGMIQG